MPQLIIPIAIAATSAASIGTSIYKAVSAPDPMKMFNAQQAAQQADAQRAQQQNSAQLEQQKMAMLRKAAPDAQAATGGSLAPDAFAGLTALLAGLPGDQLAQKLFGGGDSPTVGMGGFGSSFGAGGSSGSGSAGIVSSPGLQDLSTSLNGGTVSQAGQDGQAPFADLNQFAFSGGF